MSSPVLIEIKSRYPQMNEAMRRIADYVISSESDIIYLKASDFAEKSGVSTASVSRFVKLLGYKNFNEFRLKMAVTEEKNVNEKPEEKDRLVYNGEAIGKSPYEVSKTIFSKSIRELEDTWNMMDFDILEPVANLIDRANRIVAIGVGRSKITTEALVSRLYRIGYYIVDFCDSHEIVNITSILKEGDLLIAVSNFGQSKSVVEGVKRAKRRGVTVVGITSVKDSPLAQYSDYVLFSAYDYASDKMGKLYEPSSENVAQLVLVDCLYMMVATKHEKENLSNYRAFSEEISTEHVNK